jgi:hypothetical protein
LLYAALYAKNAAADLTAKEVRQLAKVASERNSGMKKAFEELLRYAGKCS